MVELTKVLICIHPYKHLAFNSLHTCQYLNESCIYLGPGAYLLVWLFISTLTLFLKFSRHFHKIILGLSCTLCTCFVHHYSRWDRDGLGVWAAVVWKTAVLSLTTRVNTHCELPWMEWKRSSFIHFTYDYHKSGNFQ